MSIIYHKRLQKYRVPLAGRMLYIRTGTFVQMLAMGARFIKVSHLPLVGRSKAIGNRLRVGVDGTNTIGIDGECSTPTRTLPLAAFDLPTRGRWRKLRSGSSISDRWLFGRNDKRRAREVLVNVGALG